MPRCEGLACLDANVSYASMRESRIGRCETLEIPAFSCLFILPKVCYYKGAMGKANKKSKHKGIKRHSRRGKPKPNRQYKDSVFVSLFSRDKKTRRPASISLYNALHEEKISDDEKIEFIELKDVLYHKEKNDVSFMVAGKIIVLVEHQSTVNENMPLRFLLYIAAIYQLRFLTSIL